MWTVGVADFICFYGFSVDFDGHERGCSGRAGGRAGANEVPNVLCVPRAYALHYGAMDNATKRALVYTK